MQFNEFSELLKAHFQEMAKDKTLLVVDVDKDEFWNLYLESFPEGTNPIYRVRREFDCNCCKGFIRKVGNVVAITKDLKVISLWDVQTGDSTYQPVVDALSKYIKSHPISDKFYIAEKFLLGRTTVGQALSHKQEENGKVTVFNHFHLPIPEQYRVRGEQMGTFLGQFRDTRNVFKRSLDELTKESVDVVLELISQNSLYRGEEWKSVLQDFRKHQEVYSQLTDEQKELYCWERTAGIGPSVGRIRNHSIGTLLVDISEGLDLDQAVRKYEAVVAPTNYKRPKAIFTKKMVEEAQKKIEELGYLPSLGRRFAHLDDITVNNILFANRDTAKKMAGTVFDEMIEEVKVVDPRKFSKVEEIGIKDFIEKVLPTATDLEVLFEGSHRNRLVSLIAPKEKDSKTMFKWNNNFSWAYLGNLADSDIKQNVKNAGGAVDGVLRFSIQWNDQPGEHDGNDDDAHCIITDGGDSYHSSRREIYYANKKDLKSGGELDVDIINPEHGKAAVENITFPSLDKLQKGTYLFFVHGYCNRGGATGFRAEIEFNGQIHSYNYTKPVRTGDKINVAEVTWDGKNFTIKEFLSSNLSVQEVWGVKTNQFVPVSVLMYSPNYWDGQNGVGNRHYFFMLKGCNNPETPNGFYNEYLDNQLLEHKRVFEALGSKMAVAPEENQLSGIGFSSTQRAEIIVKVKGSTERVLKIKI